MDAPAEDPKAYTPGALDHGEEFWRDHCEWLHKSGYKLRPRYQPDWKPSWEATKKEWFMCEDGIAPRHFKTLDARRVSDGKRVMLKRYDKSIHPHEADIAQFLSSEQLLSDPGNHCVPIYEVLQVPDSAEELILVMPELRDYGNPEFETLGELVEFFRQIFEGVQFMHKHHVAHRDISTLNVMMDASSLFLDEYHPYKLQRKLDLSGPARYSTRTQTPVKYYLTDFGLSRKYDPEAGPPREIPIRGGDKTVPEFQKPLDPCDPFPTDVYYVGNLIRQNFTEGYKFASPVLGLDFMKPLIADMVQDDPSKRPTMDEVVKRFDGIRASLSSWTLRSRVARQNDSPLVIPFLLLTHWRRRLTYIVKRVPALPSPPK
ncbi:hypothetical protein HGRIS_006691 [Hohenbuehelia grisea]|uniref:Protein kinase domain-containing protein n=1 Tax=Hohenbuehelia grisea TaxID=104357 RepID=A0ABR3JA36_9AGAR